MHNDVPMPKDRIDRIHRLFNELHLDLGKYAVRYGVDTDKVCELRNKIDGVHHDFAILESRCKRPEDLFTIRMLGDNVTFRRDQWEQLHDSLATGSELAFRIHQMLNAPKDEEAITENANRYGSASS